MIYLIRHGRTEANDRHLYCGSTDLPLSDAGRQELETLHYSVGNVRFAVSGMLRTVQTLQILFGDVPYEIDPAFREIDFGKFELHSYEELKNDPEYQTWITGNNERNVPPGGESGEAMTARVLAAFAKLRREPGDTVLISHGGVIAAIMEKTFPNEGKNRYQWQPRPGHGYCLDESGYHSIP